MFQASRVLRDSGILVCSWSKVEGWNWIGWCCLKSQFAIVWCPVLLESGLVSDSFYFGMKNIFYKTGHFILNDELTRVNMDFIHDVCYQGLFSSIKVSEMKKNGRTKSIRYMNTIYQALSQLPDHVKKLVCIRSLLFWQCFPEGTESCLFKIPVRLPDIGRIRVNGQWLAAFNADVEVTIMDLPAIGNSKKKIAEKQLLERVKFFTAKYPRWKPGLSTGIWCNLDEPVSGLFSEKRNNFYLNACRKALSAKGKVFILEPFWDRQRFETTSFCLQQTSLYSQRWQMK